MLISLQLRTQEKNMYKNQMLFGIHRMRKAQKENSVTISAKELLNIQFRIKRIEMLKHMLLISLKQKRTDKT